MMKKFLTQAGFMLAVYLFLPLCFISAEEGIRSFSKKPKSQAAAGWEIEFALASSTINPMSASRSFINTVLSNGQEINIPSIELNSTDSTLDGVTQTPLVLIPIAMKKTRVNLLRKLLFIHEIVLELSVTAIPPSEQSRVAFTFSLVEISPDNQIVKTINFGSARASVPIESSTSSLVSFSLVRPIKTMGLKRDLKSISLTNRLFLQVARDNTIPFNYAASVYLTGVTAIY